jgi:benzoate membrane transport protein
MKMKQSLSDGWSHFTMSHVSSGIIAWLFGVSGPLLIVLQAAARGGLSADITSSWVFAIFVIGGILSIFLSVRYRQPIPFAFSIPGAVLVGSALAGHPFSTVIGAYLVTGIVILLLGLFAPMEKIMKRIPMPIMMGMVSGVLLPFGTDIIKAVVDKPILNGSTLLAFLILSAFPFVAKKVPPILGAIVVSVILLQFMHLGADHLPAIELAKPQLYAPSFDFGVIAELVIPLAITVIGIQNAQGIAVLKSAEYTPPVKAMTLWSGIASIANGLMGAHTACVAGPMTAILADKENGAQPYRYYGAIVMGAMWIVFGLFAPTAVLLTQSIPASLIQLLGGLAMIGVLVNSLQMSFSTKYKMGALFAFIITVSNVTVLNIGAPFWGIVGGIVASLILDRQDWRRQS